MNYASKSGVPGIPNQQQQPHVPNLQKQQIGHLPQQSLIPNVQSQILQSSSQQHLTITTTTTSSAVGNSSQLSMANIIQTQQKLTGNQQASFVEQQQQYNQFLQQNAGVNEQPLALTRISTTETIKSQNGSLNLPSISHTMQQPAMSPTNPNAFRQQQKIQAQQQQHVQQSAKINAAHGQIRSLPIATPAHPLGAASIPQHPQQAHIPQTPQPLVTAQQPAPPPPTPPQQQQQKSVPSPQKILQSTSPAKSIATAAAQPTQMASNVASSAKPSSSAVIPSIPIVVASSNNPPQQQTPTSQVAENQSKSVSLPIPSTTTTTALSPVIPKLPVTPAATTPSVSKTQTPPMVTKSNMKLATINSPRVKQSPLRKTTPTKIEKIEKKETSPAVTAAATAAVIADVEKPKSIAASQPKTIDKISTPVKEIVKEVKETTKTVSKVIIPSVPAAVISQPVTPTTIKTNSVSTPDDRTNKRKRTKAIPFQSPLPELALITKLSVIESTSAASSPKNVEDKLTLFYKNEFLAVRNSDGGFFLCQTLQNVFKTSPKIRIRWLSEKGKDAKYSLDFCDVTDLECVLTTVDLDKVEKEVYKLPKTESERITNILKKAIDVEKGVVPRPDVTEENENGCKLIFCCCFSFDP